MSVEKVDQPRRASRVLESLFFSGVIARQAPQLTLGATQLAHCVVFSRERARHSSLLADALPLAESLENGVWLSELESQYRCCKVFPITSFKGMGGIVLGDSMFFAVLSLQIGEKVRDTGSLRASQQESKSVVAIEPAAGSERTSNFDGENPKI